MKYYIISGERSGDLHASNLIKEIKALDPSSQVRGIGGDLSKEAGVEVFKHYKEISFMGLIEVLANIFKISQYLKATKKDMLEFKPDVLILVDFAGFNMRMAKFAKENGLKVFYYISPKIWAWNTKRVEKIKRYVDRMFVILPFEREFYKKFGVKVDFVGNPILDSVKDFKPNLNFRTENGLDQRPVIAILPGSRKQEIERMLHFMLSLLPAFKDYQFVVAGVSNLTLDYYQMFRRGGEVKIVIDKTYDLLNIAQGALVTSGTATLETAFFKVPQLVGYKMNLITFWLGKAVVKVKFISLVNLILGRELIKELIQDNFHPNLIRDELRALLTDPVRKKEINEGYEELLEKMGSSGASKRTAELMLDSLRQGVNSL